MTRVAAVDIGTNSVRLLVADLDAPGGPLSTLDRRMHITRLGQGVDATRRLAPEAIDRMDEALGWLMWLDPEERRLVWLRAEGMPWKRITLRLGIGRTTAWQRWMTALLKIAVRLNAAAEQDGSNIRPLNKVVNSAVESV